MAEILDNADIPYLKEILYHLPISSSDKEDMDTYIQNVVNVIAVNYRYEQYQFAYFGLHLLYMTYIYCTIWKIANIIGGRYSDAIIFARPYNGKDLDFENVESIFEYSNTPEKEIPKILKIIGLDNSQIKIIAGLVDTRNDLAHASGKFEILKEDAFKEKANAVLTSMRNIHKCIDEQIRNWFKDVLLKYCSGDFGDYTNTNDFIFEQMIQSFNLSVNELLVCNEMSVNELRSDYPALRVQLNTFKQQLKTYCEDKEYV